MKPKHVARARKYISKRWYYRLRAIINHKMFTLLDKALITCDMKDVHLYCQEMERFAKKEAYYTNKFNSISPVKEQEP